MSILHITFSANPGASNSSLLGAEVVAKLGGTAVTRDTNAGIPHIDSTWTGGQLHACGRPHRGAEGNARPV